MRWGASQQPWKRSAARAVAAPLELRVGQPGTICLPTSKTHTCYAGGTMKQSHMIARWALPRRQAEPAIGLTNATPTSWLTLKSLPGFAKNAT